MLGARSRLSRRGGATDDLRRAGGAGGAGQHEDGDEPSGQRAPEHAQHGGPFVRGRRYIPSVRHATAAGYSPPPADGGPDRASPRRPLGASDLRGAAPRAAARVPLPLRAPRSRRRRRRRPSASSSSGDTLREARTRAKSSRAVRSPAPATCGSPARASATTSTSSTARSSCCATRRKPYVVDFEQVGVFSLYQQLALTRPWASERLRRAILDDRCQHLLPWSDAARDGLLNVVGDSVAHKVDDRAPGDPPRRRARPRPAATGRCACCSSAPRSTRRAASRRSAPRPRAENVQLDVISYVPDDFDVAGRRDRPRARPPRPRRAPVRRSATCCCSRATWTRSATSCSRRWRTGCR